VRLLMITTLPLRARLRLWQTVAAVVATVVAVRGRVRGAWRAVVALPRACVQAITARLMPEPETVVEAPVVRRRPQFRVLHPGIRAQGIDRAPAGRLGRGR